MFPRTCLALVLLLASTHVWSQVDTNGTTQLDTNGAEQVNTKGTGQVEANGTGQVDTNGTEEATSSLDEVQMSTPPPVSGANYSTAFASETQQSSNVRAGMTISTVHSNNVVGGDTLNPVSDVSYSIWPTLALDATTTRLHSVLTYSPGFTFYQRMSSLNQSDQNVALDLSYRLSPNLTLSFRDSFQKTSNPFNQPNPLLATQVSGSTPPPNVAVIAPATDQLSNGGNAQLTYQFSADGMVGLSGSFTSLHYLNPAEVPGLSNSSSSGGSAFYSRRLLERYYIGVSYQYLDMSTSQARMQTNTQTQTVFFFSTVYLKPTLSLSLSAGPQHSDIIQRPLPASRSWSPLMMASLGWQGGRTSLAASYAQTVTSGGGLNGANHSNTANLSGRWQLSRTWSVGLSASYALYKTVTTFPFLSSSGGHTVSGTVSAQRPIGQHLSIQAGYTRVQQSYAGIAATSVVPDTDREFVSISYQFARPLKR